MKTMSIGFFLFLFSVGLVVTPMEILAQIIPGDGDCPICFIEEGDPDDSWCDTWLGGESWCASVGGVCVSGGELCMPEVASALTIDGSDADEYQVGWDGFPPYLEAEGVGLKAMIRDGRARLMSCKGTIILRAYAQRVQSELKAEVAAIAL